MKSRVFVCVISRNTLNDSSYSISTLKHDSACDNVLLEYYLALELLVSMVNINFTFSLLLA